MVTGGGRVSKTGPGWEPSHVSERHAPRVTGTLTSAVQDGAWRTLKQHVAREDEVVQPRVGKQRHLSRSPLHRRKERTINKDCSEVQHGSHCHSQTMTYLRVGKFEEVVKVWETDQTVPLQNCAVVEVKSEGERRYSQTLSLWWITNPAWVERSRQPATILTNQGAEHTHQMIGSLFSPPLLAKRSNRSILH